MSQAAETSPPTPLPRPERPLRADARRNRERVLAAARAAFAESGREAQMDDVARRAEVGVGTVYRHFPTKDALIEALVADVFWGLVERAREAREAPDAWAAFEDLLWSAAERMAGDRALTEVIASAPGAMAAAAEPQQELNALAADLIRRAQEQGTLRPDVLIDDVPMLMCGVGSATQRPHCSHAAWRRHLAILLDGLRASAATGRLPA